MTSAETMVVSVSEIAAMGDVELTYFIQQNRHSDGDYDLPVVGWEKLSKDERCRLAKRLEAQKRNIIASSPTSGCGPLDLDDLDARLRQISPNEGFSLRSEPRLTERSRRHTPPIDGMRLEIEAYHELLKDSGRPLYPIDLIQDVYRHPANYAEMLRPWQEYATDVCAEGIIQRQLQRWQDFRKWQNDNRGREDEDGGFPAYAEQRKRWIKEDYPLDISEQFLAEIEADLSCLKSEWDQTQWLRRRQRRLCKEHGCRGFYDYVKAVERRLARHGFIRPFELNENPKKQGKLTTWIEYLSYEYWWLDKYISDIERLEPEHDKLWQELVDQNIPRPHETTDFVRTVASPMERQGEEDRAWEAVQRSGSEAKRIYVLTQKDPKRLEIPMAKRISMLKVAGMKLDSTRRRFEQIRERNNRITQFIRGTFGYAGAKRNAALQRVLVQWVLDQVPLIEGEMHPSGTTRRTKRRLTGDQEPIETQESKRVRIDHQEPRLTRAAAHSTAGQSQPEPCLSLDQGPAEPKNIAGDVQTTSQELRRSKRIAASRGF